MSRYSPSVLPIPRTTLAEALADGVGAFMAMRTQRRREGFEDAQEGRAQAADTRANAFLGIQQGDAAIRQERAGWEREDRPLRQAVDLAGAYNVGVERTRPEDGMPDVPYDGIAVPGTNYFLRPDATARGQAERTREVNATLARERMAAGLESWLLRGQTAENVARIRAAGTVQAAGVRAAGGAAQDGAAARAYTSNARAVVANLDGQIARIQSRLDSGEIFEDEDIADAEQQVEALRNQRLQAAAALDAGLATLAQTGNVGGAPTRTVSPAPAAGGAPTGARPDGTDPRVIERNRAVRTILEAAQRAKAAGRDAAAVDREVQQRIRAIDQQDGMPRR